MSLLDSNGFIHRSCCLELGLHHPCIICKIRLAQPPGAYDTGCCWMVAHYLYLNHYKRSEEEIKDRFKVCLNISNEQVPVPERLLYIRLVVDNLFPKLTPLVLDLAKEYCIELLDS